MAPGILPAVPRSGALELNGTNSFVNVPDAPNLDNTSTFTLAYWFRAYSYTSGGAGLVSKRNAISDNNAYTTFLQTDRLIYVDIDGSNNRFSSATAFATNQWYHVAITFDGSQATNQRARLYVNGALDKVAAEASAAVPDYNSSLKVGLTHSNVTTYLNGALADVRFYRRALSNSEIAALAALKSAPSVATGPAPAATNSLPALLTGTASDDGQNGSLTANWSLASGPGPVSFAASNQPATVVTFMASGQYVVRLAASNSSAIVFSDLPVSVSPNPNLYADWVVLALPGVTNSALLAPGRRSRWRWRGQPARVCPRHEPRRAGCTSLCARPTGPADRLPSNLCRRQLPDARRQTPNRPPQPPLCGRSVRRLGAMDRGRPGRPASE